MAPVALDSTSPLRDRSILVTGGTGSFGYAFVARCLRDGARKVVVYSRGEAKRAEMRAAFPDSRLDFRTGDVRNPKRLKKVFRDGFDVVIHAAALKRVEVCADEPEEAFDINVIGTQNVADACTEAGVAKALLLSTDKAAAPSTHYGTTKLNAEGAWIGSNIFAANTPTRFSCSRYGNVTKSTGSVIPTWRSQRQSGTITVTDPDMTRFFMSIEDAVDLVVVALTEMRGGEIFVPKLGCARIMDLAHAVAPECAVQITGMRPGGEKLHEELVTEHEARSTYDAGSYLIIEPAARTWGAVPPLPYPKVPAGFSYRSDTGEALSGDELAEMVAA